MKLRPTVIGTSCLALLSQFFWSDLALAEDWPAWRHDGGRSGVTDEQLPAQLHLQWSREMPPLKPAWPEDARLHFDASYQPVVAGKLMYVGSSRNDSVTAYDTDTGERRWRFFASGPVRFAPVVYGGSVYFGADDGCLYRLDARSGELVTKWDATPSGRMAIGNERLISVWPVRGGPVVVGETLHFSVGVWPFEGTYLTKIALEDGAELAPLTSLDASTPQGYLASNGSRLVIPCGRANAICRDLDTGGKFGLKYSSKGRTDHHVIAHEEWMFHGGKIVSLDTGETLGFDADRPLVSGGKLYFSAKGKLHAYDVKNLQVVEKVNRKGQTIKVGVPKPLWQYAEQPVTAVHLKTPERVYAHHGNTIFAIDVPGAGEKAKLSFTAEIEGTCSSMLAADGKLFVVTTEGGVYCFGPDRPSPKHHTEDKGTLAANPAWAERAGVLLEQTKADEGYCLALGIGTGGLVEELARQSHLTIIAIDSDAKLVDDFRRRLDSKGLYGTRVVAIHGTLDELQLPPYLANLVVSENFGDTDIGEADIRHAFRVLRPYGGVACFEMTKEQNDAFVQLAAKGKLPNAVLGRSGRWTTLIREGALPGSADWTHEYGDASNTLMSRDQLVKAPLGVLWFGGPSSDGSLFFDRHRWGPSLAVIEGRMLIQGEEVLTSVDVYTGRILWQKKIARGTGPGRRANWGPAGFDFVALKDAIYLTHLDRCLVLDPRSGEKTGEFRLPEGDGRWGSIRLVGDLMLVPVFPKKEEGNHPLKLMALNRHTGDVIWTRETDVGFPMVAAGKNSIFFVEGDLVGLYKGADKNRRLGIPVATAEVKLGALDARTGDVKWSKTTQRIPSWLAYSEEYDVLVSTNKSGIDAHYGADGELKWSQDSDGAGFRGHPENYYGRVILRNNQVIDQRGPGLAYNLESGEPVMHEHPLTGELVPWSFTKSGHHCNYAIASEHLLTFRAADAGFCDLETGGTGRLTGFRSGCRNSLIPANGVLNAPNFAFGCSCSYSIFTSLALMHIPESDMWTYSAHKAQDGPVRQLGINLGALGDRTAENGTLWMDYPSVGGSSPNVPIKLVTDKPEWFRLPSTQVEGEGLKWVAASGVSGVKSIQLPVFIGKEDDKGPERTYTVRLSFVEPTGAEPGERTFDVSIQNTVVAQDLDVVGEAGGARRILVREFGGIKADGGAVTITFTPKAGRALVSGVEIVAEAADAGR
jgi:outer membrane protein assembly factor BamB